MSTAVAAGGSFGSLRGARVLPLCALLSLFFVSHVLALTWESIGPEGGDRFVIEISPCSPQTILVLGHNGVHRSRDAGENWTLTNNTAMGQDSFLDVLFAGPTCQEIFVAGARSGIWRSTDGGDTWEQRASGLPLTSLGETYHPVTSLVLLPTGMILASVSSSPDGMHPPNVVYRSPNQGQTWFHQAFGIVIPATADNLISLMSLDASRRAWVIVSGVGVYEYSTGVWQPRNGNLPAEALRATFLAHDPSNSNRLLLATEDSWVYESIDSGVSWSRLPLPDALVPLTVLPLAYTAVIDPNNPEFVVVRTHASVGSLEHPLFRPSPAQTAGGGLYVSADGGRSWVRMPIFANRLAVDPTAVVTDEVPGIGLVTRSRTWYRTGGGTKSVAKSVDGIASFEVKTNGIRTLWVNEIWVHPDPPPGEGKLVFAATEAGLFGLIDGPEGGWLHAASTPNTVYSWSFAADPEHHDAVLYATGSPAWGTPEWRGVFRLPLSCFGAACDPAENQLLGSAGVWRLATSQAAPGRIVAAGQEDGVMVSDDDGRTWQTVNEGLTLPASITDLVLDSRGEPLLASFRSSNGDPVTSSGWHPAEGETGGVYAFDSTSGRWTLMPGLTDAVYSLKTSGGASLSVFAATSGGIYRYRSVDGWVRISQPRLFNDVAIDPDRPEYIYGATRFGVQRTTDGGAHWTDLSDGLTARIVLSLDFDPSDGTLYAGLEGGSVSRLLPDPTPIPMLEANPSSVSFGRVPTGFYKTLNLSLTNKGEANLVIRSFQSSNPAFVVAATPALPATITPGSWIDVTLRFTPTVATTTVASIVATGNGGNMPLSIPVAGEGYSSTGRVVLTVNPPSGKWRVTTPWGAVLGRTGSYTVERVPTGVYLLEWQPLSGYALPSNQPVTIMVTAGATTQVTGEFTPLVGVLSSSAAPARLAPFYRALR